MPRKGVLKYPRNREQGTHIFTGPTASSAKRQRASPLPGPRTSATGRSRICIVDGASPLGHRRLEVARTELDPASWHDTCEAKLLAGVRHEGDVCVIGGGGRLQETKPRILTRTPDVQPEHLIRPVLSDHSLPVGMNNIGPGVISRV